jgi:16S rRNA (guanine966-N2)-methyltransferase
MRIISGSKRGMALLGPKGSDTRPITDRVKESLFSVLYKYDIIEGRIIADLFCGTGSMGLEAISRGAAKAIFVDSSRAAIDRLESNIEKAGFVKESKVIRSNAFKIGTGTEPADLIFVDPPYVASRDVDEGSQLAKLLDLLSAQTSADAIVIVRTHAEVNLLEKYAQLSIIDRRKWGTMAVTILQRSEQNDQ